MKLEGNTVLITGGTSGIGYELASQLHRRGNTVIVTGRRQDALAEAERKLPGITSFRCDVRDPASVAAMYGEVIGKFPHLNVLINNAGVMHKINLHAFGPTPEAVMEEIDINLTGTIRMVLQFLPHLKEQERAAIINVSSGLAFNPYPIAPIYGATKAAVHSFTQSLRVQLKQTKVQVFELAPPAVDTPLNHKFSEDIKATQLITTARLVDEALKGLAKDHLEIRVGFAKLSKLMSRLAPSIILKMMSKPVDEMLAQPKQLTP